VVEAGIGERVGAVGVVAQLHDLALAAVTLISRSLPSDHSSAVGIASLERHF
jgi:hypothetical protein